MSRAEPLVRLPDGFEDEFPDASALATEVFLNLGVLSGGIRGAVEAFLRSHGITSLAAFNVLTVLGGDADPLQPSQIAERMMVTRATTSGLLDALERRGLVERTRGDGDGRQRLVVLTRRGRRLVDTVVPEIHCLERALLSCLSERELRALRATTAKLQHHVMSLAPDVELGI